MRRILLTAVAVVALGGCRDGERFGDSATIRQQASELAGGDIADRREPRAFLDSARHFLQSHDTSAAARMFGLAAPILRAHATETGSSAHASLHESARELDSLVAAIRGGHIVTTSEYVSILVRLNLTEADHHRSLAATAWSAGDAAVAGEELVLSVEHLNRAWHDIGVVPAHLVTLVAESRALGAAMAGAAPFEAADVGARMAELDDAIQAARRGRAPVIAK